MPANPSLIIFWACAIEISSMLVLSSYPSLIPILQGPWQMNNSQAGVINGLFFAGELVSVVVVSILSDRYDPKKMYLSFLAMGSVAALAFAVMADGFASAAVLRFAEGVALGGTYMPGLRILVDNVAAKFRSRATAFYTASYYLAAGLSFFLVLGLEPVVGWRWTIVACAMGPLAAFFLALFLIPKPPKTEHPPLKLFDLRPVLNNRRALGFSLLYGIHNAELTAFASWLVPFLFFASHLGDTSAVSIDLATIAALVSIVALPASVGGNEMAHKFSRQIWISVVAVGSAVTAVAFGLSPGATFGIVVLFAFIYSAAIAADSSAITGGLILSADPERRGSTLAVYSLFGFAGAAAGPALFGLILDVAGGETLHLAWVTAFACVALLVLLQPLIAWKMVRKPLMYD